MKSRTAEDESHHGGAPINGSKSIKKHKEMMMKKKNMRRLGGGGLSLEAFANAKSTTNNYNPALIKKQKEFYKNAKYVSRYKKSLKQQGKQNDISSAIRQPQDENEGEGVSQRSKKNKKKKDSSHSLKELYEKKREEEERTRIERDTIFQAKKEKRERVESQRKAAREKMFKRTRKGQPVMKYRIEHLLQTIQGSTS